MLWSTKQQNFYLTVHIARRVDCGTNKCSMLYGVCEVCGVVVQSHSDAVVNQITQGLDDNSGVKDVASDSFADGERYAHTQHGS